MSILNSEHDPYLAFIETERRLGRSSCSPWTTKDPELLRLAQDYFPEVPLIPAEQLEPPDLTPVEILPLSALPPQAAVTGAQCFIAVGGPPAAAVALEQALQGNSVLYASDLEQSRLNGKQVCPIWAGAGNHGEPDALTEAPAYILGQRPLPFIVKEVLRACLPKSDPSKVLDPDYPWLSLNLREWLCNPRQWPEALRVAWGNHRLAKSYDQDLKQGSVPKVLQRMRQRTQLSAHYLKDLNQRLGKILREPRGSLLLATSPKQVAALQQAQAFLRAESLNLLPLTPDEAFQKYGVRPRRALALMEKTHDFIFEPDFLKKLTQWVQQHGGEIKNNWRLKRVFVESCAAAGGILEFDEACGCEKKTHYRAFSRAHLSLGPTPFKPHLYDLISVTGVSMNALVVGGALTGGPLVCGGSNHLVPLLPPQIVDLNDPLRGQSRRQAVTFVRLSTGGSVSPLNRGRHWYHYDGRQAVHLLHWVRATLPPEMRLIILSARGCNRVIGKDGQQVELHPSVVVAGKKKTYTQVTIQMGAGGGGLTQMGAVPGHERAQS